MARTLRHVEELTEHLPPTVEPTLNPLDLARWLTSHAEPIRERWLAYLMGRAQDHDGVEELLDAFLECFLVALPQLMGAYREQIEPIWTDTAELFGSMACSRGLAAGEAVEEAQFLRETIMRLLYQNPPRVSQGAMGLRDILRLNRAVDQLVTHASVGHTDALFFALFQGSGVPERLSDDVRYEIRSQLEGLRGNMDVILGQQV